MAKAVAEICLQQRSAEDSEYWVSFLIKRTVQDFLLNEVPYRV